MEGTEVTLEEMLARREERVRQEEELLSRYHYPVLTFCMNIPGPIKTNAAIREAFLQGKKELLRTISQRGWYVLSRIDIAAITGDELLLSVDAPAGSLKEAAMKIEEESPLGRLYDMDVVDVSGRKLSRLQFRNCLICGRQAQECARSRTHTVPELQEAVERLLQENGFLNGGHLISPDSRVPLREPLAL